MLTLILENAPHQQARQELTHVSGDLVIGRNTDADWHIEDPDMYVSRKHCIISGDERGYSVTDASTGGLFVDGSSTPLGAGNTKALENNMRLRLGNFIIRVSLAAHAAVQNPPVSEKAKATANPFDDDGFFDDFKAVELEAPRPKNLPDPFEKREHEQIQSEEISSGKVAPPVFDDVFTLDPILEPTRETFSSATPSKDFDFGPSDPAACTKEVSETPPEAIPQTRSVPGVSDEQLRLAFFEGLGLDPAKFTTDDQLAQMRDLGQRYRMLADGLFHLLRTRAKEKTSARVAQTLISNASVNPVKFAASTDEAVSSLIAQKGEGYLDPDRAIVDSFRDLTEHQIRSWNAIQSALHKMVDRFDPAEFEKAMEEHSFLEQLIAGGRSAKLWQLYEEQYQKIATSAETKFLGEVGADFRDAYENSKGK